MRRLLAENPQATWTGATVSLGICEDLEEVSTRFRRAQDNFRARIKAAKKTSLRWRNLKALAWLQISPGSAGGWYAHVNIVAPLTKIDPQEFRVALTKQWAEPALILRCFQGRGAPSALRRFVRASADYRHQPTTWQAGSEQVCEKWLHSRGVRNIFEWLRFSVGMPPRSALASATQCLHSEPMPSTFGFSTDHVFFEPNCF